MTLKKHLFGALSCSLIALLFLSLLVLFLPTNLSFAQQRQTKIPPQTKNLNQSQRIIVNPGLSAEYLNLTIGWDEDVHSSRLKSYLFNTNTEISIKDGFSVHLILGYSLTNFDDLTFRELPFSIELGVQEISGILLGSEFNKRLFYLSEYEINLYGQFVYYYGFNNEWNMPDLNVDGTLNGSPSWMRAQIGPKIRYQGLRSVTPFICATYNKFWGTFTVDQVIQDIRAVEEKKITGKSNFALSFGSEFEVTPNLFMKGSLSFLPYNGGLDLLGLISIQFALNPQIRRTP